MLVVADAGLSSAGNLHALDEAGLRFIVDSRLKNVPGDLEMYFTWNGDHTEDGMFVATETPRRKNPA
ncbi:hypothetical protein [Brevibacterium sp. JSBI002]|uniref:hypothetical protein n=1 Tax=Brevibacterium sp. JSBI002 TaxID=2886045 RepID=UPI00222E5DA0|nr:hypothetical protein [Brevibacterium sp. JSBI002]UZD63634.1 hypothetical protein LJ362_07345 [Brevibacterium sp. JSBI002]